MALRHDANGVAITPHQVFVTEAQANASQAYAAHRAAQAAASAAREADNAKLSQADKLAKAQGRVAAGMGACKREIERLMLAGQKPAPKNPTKRQRKRARAKEASS